MILPFAHSDRALEDLQPFVQSPGLGTRRPFRFLSFYKSSSLPTLSPISEIANVGVSLAIPSYDVTLWHVDLQLRLQAEISSPKKCEGRNRASALIRLLGCGGSDVRSCSGRAIARSLSALPFPEKADHGGETSLSVGHTRF